MRAASRCPIANSIFTLGLLWAGTPLVPALAEQCCPPRFDENTKEYTVIRNSNNSNSSTFRVQYIPSNVPYKNGTVEVKKFNPRANDWETITSLPPEITNVDSAIKYICTG